MNFLKWLEAKLFPHAQMDETQERVTTYFVGELSPLHIVRSLMEGWKILRNALMLVVPHEGQPQESLQICYVEVTQVHEPGRHYSPILFHILE